MIFRAVRFTDGLCRPFYGGNMLELKNISFEVSGDSGSKEILQQINLSLPDDCFIAVTGPNGGGKSTLAKIIAGIEQPTSGQILLNGEDITHMGITERAQKGISFAFQQPVRFKGITVLDLIRISVGHDLTVSQACEYLSEVGLCARDYIHREVNSSLSGGELKRIEIATSLARSAPLSIFDEPEAGIDLWSFAMLIKEFEKIHRENKASLILISHQERIIRMADRIMIIRDGRVEEIGTKEEVYPHLMAEESEEQCAFMQLENGIYGLLEPKKDTLLIRKKEIQLGIIPCVSADLCGKRLGHGAGYYDRYLSDADFYKVLLCRRKLLWEKIPTDDYDVSMDLVITD